MTGLQWEARLGQGEYGVKSGYSAEFSFQDLRLRIYTRWSLSPAVLLHLNATLDKLRSRPTSRAPFA